MVKTFQFRDQQVPNPGFGAMGISFGLGSNLTLEQAEPVLLKALELGCTFWDTAVVYQAGVNEKLLGDFIRKHNARDKIFRKSPIGIYSTSTKFSKALRSGSSVVLARLTRPQWRPSAASTASAMAV